LYPLNLLQNKRIAGVLGTLDVVEMNLQPGFGEYNGIENRRAAILNYVANSSPANQAMENLTNIQSYFQPGTRTYKAIQQTEDTLAEKNMDGSATPENITHIVGSLSNIQANMQPGSPEYMAIERRKQFLLGML
jgi:hypothetical protein